jgi:alpha-glucosidase
MCIPRSGPALLIMPVLEPLVTTVKGVFPGVAKGTIWYDWYTLQKVDVAAGENKTLSADLLHQPIFIRGGNIIPIQKAGNTTKTSRLSPWSLIVALDKNGEAVGDLFLDDGINIVQNATKEVHVSLTILDFHVSQNANITTQFTYMNHTLHTTISGNYCDDLPLANVTILGATSMPQAVKVYTDGKEQYTKNVSSKLENNVLYLTQLEDATSAGAWNGNLTIELIEPKAAEASVSKTAAVSACPTAAASSSRTTDVWETKTWGDWWSETGEHRGAETGDAWGDGHAGW